MKRWMWLSLPAALISIYGCGAGEEFGDEDQPKAPAEAKKPAPPPEAAQPAPPQPPPPADEWSKRAEEMARKYQKKLEDQDSLADESYRWAERYYREGKFDQAEIAAREALKYNPRHAGARALLYETQVLRQRGVATPESERLEKVIREMQARQQQIQLEIDNQFNTGMMKYHAGEYDEAERSFRLIIETSKWVFPPTAEVDARRQQALEMLEKTKQERKQKQLDELALKRRLAEMEEEARSVAHAIEERKRLEMLYSSAQLHFQREEYDKCIYLCDKMLYIDPNLSSVREMKVVAGRLRLMKQDNRYLDEYVYHWKKFQNFNEAFGAVPSMGLIEFPESDVWNDVIAKRRPRALRIEGEVDVADIDRQVMDKLKTMRYTVSFKDEPLKDAINFLRESTGLNFVFDASAKDKQEEPVTLDLKDAPVDAMLRLMLGTGITYFVENGVVVIATNEAFAERNVRLEIFDVMDITFRLMDLPGREIEFGEEGGFRPVDAPAEQQPVIEGEELAEIIHNTIDKASWDEEGRAPPTFQNGLLICRNTVDTLRKVSKFLTLLRASTGILVHVEARFMQVEDTWLQQVGMDLRDAGPAGDLVGAVTGLPPQNPNGLSWLANFPYFIPVPGWGTGAANNGGVAYNINGAAAPDVQLTGRVQSLMYADVMRNKFFQDYMAPLGGGSFTYSLDDQVAIDAFIRLVSRSQKGYVLMAPRITVHNTQRAHVQVSSQMSYVRDWNLGGGGLAIMPDPILDHLSDAIVLDVKPIVSSDRKYVTMELRATAAQIWPPPPHIAQLRHSSININGENPIPLPPLGPLPNSGNSGGLVELPQMRMQKIRTTVVIPDGGVLFLGGFAGYHSMDMESGIPIWKHLPVIGQIGKNEYRGKGRKQTLFIIKSDIVIPSDEEKKRF